GLETALAVVAQVLSQEGSVDWQLLAKVMSSEPAKIGGVSEIAGRRLEPGEPATFTMVAPNCDWTVDGKRGYSLSANTPFQGAEFQHYVVLTAIDGSVVYRRCD